LKQKLQISSADAHRFSSQRSEQLVPVTDQNYSKSELGCHKIDYMRRCETSKQDDPKKGFRAFVSPSFRKRGWSSEELYGTGRPSPIATVYPQKNASCVGKEEDGGCTDEGDVLDEEDTTPAKKGKKKGLKTKQGKKKARKKLVKAPSRRQPKRTASTPIIDHPRKRDITPARVPTRRRNVGAPSSEILAVRNKTSPDWIQKNRKAITPSVERLHQNPSTPSWLRARRNARNRESQMSQSKETGVVQNTPPIWKKQHCDDSLGWQNTGSQIMGTYQSPYSLRSYGNTPKMSSGHIECSKVGLFQSPYRLRQYGEPSKPTHAQSKMEIFDFVDNDVSASYRKMTFAKKKR
jgi:hypothetical protein